MKKGLTKEEQVPLVAQKMNKPKPIPTPRTDKETETFEVDPVTKAITKIEPTRWVTAEFARKLERELAVVRQRLDDETGAS